MIVDNLTTKYKDLNNIREGLWDQIKTALPNDGIVTPEIMGEYSLSKRPTVLQKQGNDVQWTYFYNQEAYIEEHSVTDNVLRVLYDTEQRAWKLYWLPDVSFSLSDQKIIMLLEIGYGGKMETGEIIGYVNIPTLPLYNGEKNEGRLLPIKPVVELRTDIPQ